jgi:hypothetical protein
MNDNTYPIYVISKGRADCCLSSMCLQKNNVKHVVVVEPQELAEYKKHMPDAEYIVTPFSNLNQKSIPVRNFIWDHSIANGDLRHWCVDDNIREWRYFNGHERIKVNPLIGFQVVEELTHRFLNVGISGPAYTFFTLPRQNMPPFRKNCHVYSCMLIRNDLPFRWRGPWNEDVDLNLQSIAIKQCTLQVNAITCDKSATMTMKGGNSTDYQDLDSRAYGARSLQQKWPGIVDLTNKYGRPHFHVKDGWQMFRDIPLLKNTEHLPRSFSLKIASKPVSD